MKQMCQLKKVILVLHVQLVLLVCVLSVSDVEPEVGNLFDSSSDNEQPDTEGGHAPSGTEEEEDFGLRRVFEEQLSLEEQRTERAKVKMDQRRRVIRAFVDDVNRLLTEPPIDNRRTKRTVDCLARQLQTLRAREQATLLEQLARLQSRPASERTHVYKALLLGGEGTEEEPLLVVGPGHPSETSTSSASPNKSEQTANAKDVDALLIRLLVLNEFTSDHKLIDETDEDLPIWIDTLSRMKKGKTRAALYRELTRLKRVGPVLMHNYMAFIYFRTEIGTEAAQTGPIVINAQSLMELVTKVPILQSRKAKTTNEYDIELPFIVLRVLSQSVSDNVTDNTTRMINALRQFQDGENDAEEEENKQLLWYFFSNVAEDTHRELLSTGSSVAVNLDSLLHSLGNLRQCVRRLDGIKYTVVHELLEDIMRETRETCQMFVDLIRETRPRPSMLNRFYVNILYGVQNRVETSPLLYEWLLVLRELNKELGTVFFNEDGSVVVADVVEKSKQEKKKEEERDEVEAEQRGNEVMHITAALSSGSGNLDSGLEPFLDNTVDPREEALIYCWLFPTGEYRRRFYALIHRFGLSAEQLQALLKTPQFLPLLSKWDYRWKRIEGHPVNPESILGQLHDASQLASELRGVKLPNAFCLPIYLLFSVVPAGKPRADLINMMRANGAVDDCTYFRTVSVLDPMFGEVITAHNNVLVGEKGFERWRNMANSVELHSAYVKFLGKTTNAVMYRLRLLIYIQLWDQLQRIPWDKIRGLNGEGYGPVSSRHLAKLAIELRQFDKKTDRDWLLSLLHQHKQNRDDKSGGVIRVLHPVQLALLLQDKHLLITKTPQPADKALFERCLEVYERIAQLECLQAHNALNVYDLLETLISRPYADLKSTKVLDEECENQIKQIALEEELPITVIMNRVNATSAVADIPATRAKKRGGKQRGGKKKVESKA